MPFATSTVGSVITVGTSVIYGITVIAGLNSITLQYLSGSTVWIGGATLSHGHGFLWDTTQIKALTWEDYSGSLFLCCGGTAQISVIQVRSPGFE